jgi:DNA primase
MFPITDMDGNVLGFGGRIIGSGEPKYLNSPETPVFQKGRTFYGMELTWKEVRKTEEAFIVEGYFDLIMLYQNGIRNVLAPLGTAVTEEHVHRLRGVAKRVYMLFDSDSAGMRAAERVLSLFLDSGIDALIILLPQGDDPDTFVRREGPEALLKLKEKAILLWEFYLNNMVKRAGDLPWNNTGIIEEILSLLLNVTHPVTRSVYIKQVAEKFGLNEVTLNTMMERMEKARRRVREEKTGTDFRTGFDRRELLLLYIMLRYPEGINKISRYIEGLRNERLKGIAKFISDAYINKNAFTVDEILNSLEEEDRNLLIRVLFEFEDSINPAGALDEIIRDFELKSINDEEKYLTARIIQLQKGGDEREIQRLLNLKTELIKKKQELLKK